MSLSTSKRVSSVDVAQFAGVSQTTVSIVMRGHAERRNISPETTRRVLHAAEELNYVPNGIARNLRQQRSGSIGVLVIDLQLGWAAGVLRGMNEVFDATDYTAFVAVHENARRRARKELLSCLERRDEGVICQPVPGEFEIYTPLQRAGVPLILLGDCPEDTPDVSFVGWDSGPAARVAVEHLVQTGRKRIAFVGVDYPMRMTHARYAAYLAVLREAGLGRNDGWVVTLPSDPSGGRVLSSSLDRMFAPGCDHPDGIFALNDALALATLEELHDRGIPVPDDVALIGMGDLPMTRHSGISLSTMKEPTEEMGRQAAQLILDLIEDPSRGPVQGLITCQELKARRTTLPLWTMQEQIV